MAVPGQFGNHKPRLLWSVHTILQDLFCQLDVEVAEAGLFHQDSHEVVQSSHRQRVLSCVQLDAAQSFA